MGNMLPNEQNEIPAENLPKPVGVSYTIGGVKVEFPAKAYPSQVSMMDKIIRGCHRAQNCLLESPTGSGKTLALLCGALAWQKAEARRVEEVYLKELEDYSIKEEELKKKLNAAVQKTLETTAKQNPTITETWKEETNEQSVKKENSSTDIMEIDEDDEIFLLPVTKKIKSESDAFSSTSNSSIEPTESSDVINDIGTTKVETTDSKVEKIPGLPSKPKKAKVPKIFFGTRTHKQIAQVVHELRRTVYNDVPITILSSRTHSCIMEDKYKQYKSKNDMCNELLDIRSGLGCRYKSNVKSYKNHYLLPSDVPKIWDLEDLISFGKKKMVCPYFTARELKNSADVIFCPYNYLIDPLIRKSLDISLKGDILILDEAHNIEDTCRNSASFMVEQKQIQEAMQNCEEVMNELENQENKEPYSMLMDVLRSVSLWIDHHKNDVNDVIDYDQGKFTLFGPQAVISFSGYEFGKENLNKLGEALTKIEAEKASNEDARSISGPTKNIAEGLLLILGFLYDEKYTCDYHIVLTKSFSNNYYEEPTADNDGWFKKRKKAKEIIRGWQYSLHFWCLNPATVFFDIKEKVRSVVLTSGTLSPIDSFQSELGAMFPITLEANHVIDANQCWVGSLGLGPSYVKLDGTYRNTNTCQFQDEIGKILLTICSFVPHGVLCFVSSYTLLDKLRERWNFINLTEKIEEHKVIKWEPRRGDELESLLTDFYQLIEETSGTPVGQGVTGVLFLAVCRGKISEGLDFSDKNARVVVTIGIPFPNVKDSQVILKKSYNDKHQHSKGLLNGNDWYQIQAYRALNQALGRCIRHRRDWGAILLLDSRFSNDSYYKGLSKWVRNRVRHYAEFNGMIRQLSSFIQTRLQIEQNEIVN